MKPLKEYAIVDSENNVIGFKHPSDDCELDNLGDLLMAVLGFCGCGDPKAPLELIYNIMHLKDEKFNSHCEGLQARIDNYNIYKEKLNNYLKDNIDKVSWFIDYVLDQKRLLEHGGNVSGSWICDHNFYEAIQIWYNLNILKKGQNEQTEV